MMKKILGIFVCILLITTTVLPVAGIMNYNKIKKETYNLYNDRIQRVIDGNCILGDWIEQDKLVASDGATEDRFGWSVSIYEEYALVGAHLDDDNGEDSGSVYVFKRNGTNWIQHQKLFPLDGEAGDRFGTVFCNADMALIGAYLDDDNGEDSGSAYVFKRNGTNWIQQQKLLPSDGTAYDQFGYSVCLDGDTALIGASGTVDSGSSPGYAYVFKYEDTSWIQVAKLNASDGETYDQFGYDSSICGDYAIIGARRDNDLGTTSGSAYIFYYDGYDWIEQVKLTAPDGAIYDWFGDSVEICGDTVFIGAPRDDDKGFNSGSVYIFKRQGAVWPFQEKLTASDGRADDWFGASISMDGNHVVIGTPGLFGSNTAGFAYVFEHNGSSWIEQARLAATDATYDDDFGITVSISGDYTIVGVRKDDDNGIDSGSAYIFNWNQAPNAPTISGQTSGKAGTSYNYTFNSTDPDGDDILEYIIYWGDNTGEETITGPFASGEEVTGSHTWTSQDTFTIKAKAKDIYGAESNWSEFEVTIPRTKTSVYSMLQWFLDRFPLLERLLNLIWK